MVGACGFQDRNTGVFCTARLGAYFHAFSVQRAVFLSYDNRDLWEVSEDIDGVLALPSNDRLHLPYAGPVVLGNTENRATKLCFTRCSRDHHGHFQYPMCADVTPAGEGDGHQVTVEPVLQGF